MSSDQSSTSRIRKALVAFAALSAATAAFAVPASAAPGKGTAEIVLAEHSKGRTLSGQGVKVLAGSPATRTDRTLNLPITTVDPSAQASAAANGSLQFKLGKKVATLSGLHFNLSGDALKGSLDGEEIDVLKLGGKATANGTNGAVGIDGGKLRLTAGAAKTLKQKLGLQRALRHDGVGMVWLAAQANPTREAAKPIASGVASWGVLASWRSYVLGQQGPPMSKGSISVEGGATANGTLTEADAFFGFPATSGSYVKGLYGAADKLTLKTAGSVTFAKPFHCIVEIKLADLELNIDGANSSIVVGDYSYDIDKFNGMACEDQPSVLAPGTKLATLDASGVTPTYSADGKTVKWTAIPATLTAAGSVPFSPTYKEGQLLDPVTITVGLG